MTTSANVDDAKLKLMTQSQSTADERSVFARELRFLPDVVLRIIDEEALILNLHDETVFALNATGARIAQLISEGRRMAEIVELLAHEHHVHRDVLVVEITDFVQALSSRGLLVPVRDGDGA